MIQGTLFDNMVPFEILNPCSEDWEEMTPGEGGRMCEKCQHSVVDFTVLSDDEIDTVLGQRGQICARVLPSQLRQAVYAGLASSLIVLSAGCTQEPPSKPPAPAQKVELKKSKLPR